MSERENAEQYYRQALKEALLALHAKTGGVYVCVRVYVCVCVCSVCSTDKYSKRRCWHCTPRQMCVYMMRETW